MKTLSAANAAKLDEYLMGECKFSIDQLMELAGLSVAHAVQSHITVAKSLHPLQTATSQAASRKILVICGPGNNGGDGLVAARHLALMNFTPILWYPKPSFGKSGIYERLVTQLKVMGVETHVGPEQTGHEDFLTQIHAADFIVDAIFGFSFKPGPKGEIRAPFNGILEEMVGRGSETMSVDIPSGWDVDEGKPEGEQAGVVGKFSPAAVISLTAPKSWIQSAGRQGWKGAHYVGGRFLSREVAEKFDIEMAPYEGVEQVVKIDVNGNRC